MNIRFVSHRPLRAGNRKILIGFRILRAVKTAINGHDYSFMVDSAGFAPYNVPHFYLYSARIRR